MVGGGKKNIETDGVIATDERLTMMQWVIVEAMIFDNPPVLRDSERECGILSVSPTDGISIRGGGSRDQPQKMMEGDGRNRKMTQNAR